MLQGSSGSEVEVSVSMVLYCASGTSCGHKAGTLRTVSCSGCPASVLAREADFCRRASTFLQQLYGIYGVYVGIDTPVSGNQKKTRSAWQNQGAYSDTGQKALYPLP